MKTKKLLSILLALVMVVSMMASLGVSASAGKLATWEKVEKYGVTFWCRSDKVYHDDGEYEEMWRCVDCYDNGTLSNEGNFHYIKVDDEGWDEQFTCPHLVTYEPLTALVMKSNPTKTAYAVGDKIDLTGAKLTATTISNTSHDVDITSSMVSGFDSSTAGTKTVTVTYRNLTTTFDVTVAPKNECWLDLTNNEKQLDQNYNLTVNEVNGDDVTKVKLTWEIKDINAARTDNKVWDTENLCWKAGSSSTEIKQQGTAKFTLENYSSVKLDATASFKAETGFKGTASYDVTNGKVTLDTANGSDTYSKTNVPQKVINATITTDADDFKTLSATTKAAKYGTYTVTISKYVESTHKVTVNYYANATDEEVTMDSVDVADGTAITVDGNTITIGTYSFTNAKEMDAWWVAAFQTPPATVTEDLEISAVTLGF